jgi:L-histidine N-alpha-methyltransferase
LAAEARIEVHLDAEQLRRCLVEDARAGLSSRPKQLAPKWFYDARGSELFEAITALPEYYPTRTERAILEEAAPEIPRALPADTLVELGSGSGSKTRVLLDAFLGAGRLRAFVPFDVSEEALRASVAKLGTDYPDLELTGVVGDFDRHLDCLPSGGRRLVVFLGGTIGNYPPVQRRDFLARLAGALRPGEGLLLGTDLVKDASRLEAAYNDAAGVTAQFNLNVLRVMNRQLGADFDEAAFEHVAFWDADREWVEMRLRARAAHRVRLPAIPLEVGFARGEEMRTEVSAKFRRRGVEQELAAAGLELARWWTDPAGDFAVSLSLRR